MLPRSRSHVFSAQRPPLRFLGILLVAIVIVNGGPLADADKASNYIVGPNDVVVITVFDQPQLSGKFTVQPDGSFTFPLLGRVSVGGLTVQAIQEGIRAQLARGFLKNPQVGVEVDQYRSQTVIVMGEVRQPGGLEFTGSMTLLEALARAGSTTDRAAFEALVVRPRGGAPQRNATAQPPTAPSDEADVIKVDLENLQSGALSQNLLLQGGDTIFVPRAETVFVTGQVRAAGEFPFRKGMTVRQALALAGGLTDRGSSRRIEIVRKIDGRERTVDASLPDLLQPGDTLIVKERFF